MLMNNMKMMNENELDQVDGGISIFDIFTADFRGVIKKPFTLEMFQESDDDERCFGISTLEMRENPIIRAKNYDKVVRL